MQIKILNLYVYMYIFNIIIFCIHIYAKYDNIKIYIYIYINKFFNLKFYGSVNTQWYYEHIGPALDGRSSKEDR